MSFTNKDCIHYLHRNMRCPLSLLSYGVEATSLACICLDGVDFEIVVSGAYCADFIRWWVCHPATKAQFFHTLGQNYIYPIWSDSSQPLAVPGTASTGPWCLCSHLVLDVGKPNFKLGAFKVEVALKLDTGSIPILVVRSTSPLPATTSRKHPVISHYFDLLSLST